MYCREPVEEFLGGFYKSLNFKDGSAEVPAVRYLLTYECRLELKTLPQALDNTSLIKVKYLYCIYLAH